MNQFDIQPEQEINDREAYNAVLQFMGSQRVRQDLVTESRQQGDKDIFRYMKIQPDQVSFKVFLIWPIKKIFIKFVTILLLFYVLIFFFSWLQGFLAPQPRIQPTSPTLRVKS